VRFTHYVFKAYNLLKPMIPPGITLLGLGPGDPALLTRQAWQILEDATEIYVRTRQHPTVAGFPATLQVHSFDDLYEQGKNFEAVYGQIVQQVLALGQRPEGVIYAVPGHPFVAEATGPEIARRAHELGIPVQMVEGLSFIEPVLSALGVDPFPHMALVDAIELGSAHVPTFPPDAPALIAQIYSPMVASEVKLTLMEVYPDQHAVQFVHDAGTPQVKVESLALYEIDRSPHIGLLTALYVPPLGAATSFEAFQELVAHLRAPNGCPWDREQDHQTLRSDLLEETYETLAALDADDPQAMREELGDLLLQIVLHAQIASEYGEFRMSDVLRGIHTKIVHRHPHVFGDVEVDGVGKVLQNWEKLKAEERQAKGKSEAGLLDSVPVALPALILAEEYQKRAARVGFDWPDVQGVLDKVCEEATEVRAAEDTKRPAEIGDLLFAVVNLARWCHVDAESVLRETNARFKRRFSFIEQAARVRGKKVAELSPQDMDVLWETAKKEE
jgi:tetrapyrrole methylase family protein/MazG family protein